MDYIVPNVYFMYFFLYVYYSLLIPNEHIYDLLKKMVVDGGVLWEITKIDS